ncbi:MAG: arsenate reductase ArsC [Bacteroidetes bacterium]|nr:arsenate reductase ArsC [Bacteroidota bacterium]
MDNKVRQGCSCCSHQFYQRKKILVICTGNSCRSQMAEGWLRSFDETIDVFSAGTHPERKVNAYAVIVMKEVNIDISGNYPNNINEFIHDDFDYVITVCDNARQKCPVFKGIVSQNLHIGFEDPANACGSDDEILEVYRKIRDQIGEAFYQFYISIK